MAEAIETTLGSDVRQCLTLKELCSDQGYSLPKLKHSLLNTSTELDALVLEASENFKRLISGESIEVREIYGRPFKLSTSVKCLFLTNHLPRYKHGTDAEARRLRVLRFQQVPKSVNTALKKRIKPERNGILRLRRYRDQLDQCEGGNRGRLF